MDFTGRQSSQGMFGFHEDMDALRARKILENQIGN
jgi:hypothetical protein